MVRSGLEKYHPRKKKRVLLTNFRKLSNGYFLINYGEPLYQHILKNEILSKPLRYHKIQEYKRFLAAFSVLQGARLSTEMKFSMSQEVKKGPFAALIIESSLKVFWTYIQKPVWFYLLTTKDNLMGKVWGKTFSRCEMPRTALTEIAT